MNRDPKAPAPLSRRRFVAVIAAGSAALLAQPAAALSATAPPAAKKKPAAATKPAGPVHGTGTPAMTAAQRKEYERARKSTLDTLKVIRGHEMPPGTEMASIFRARRPAKKAN